MASELKAQQLKDGIKLILKNKGWTYGDLAEALSCSLPTVKRILGPEELTLGRLLQICEILETSLTDLEQLSGSETLSEREMFTDEQEQFLAKNPNFLSFISLLYSGETPQKIARDFKLTKRSVDLYLLRLEKHDLLTVDVKGRVRLKCKTMPRWQSQGALVKSRLKTLLRRFTDLTERRLEHEFRKGGAGKKNLGLNVGGYEVPEAMYRKWVEKFDALLREVQNESVFEDKYRPGEGKPMVVLSFTHFLIEHGDPEKETMKTTFGEIGNL